MAKALIHRVLGCLFASLALTAHLGAFATELTSPFPSCVKGTVIPNSHALDEDTLVLRGMAPRNEADFQSLGELEVERVLIFKNQTKNEVDQEIAQLLGQGFKRQDVLQLPFLWKDHPDFSSACQQTIKAMAWIEKSRQAGRKVFFHCTVGEDRTGYLAGLLKFWWDQGTLEELFEKELCWNGYEAGNPQKPMNQVVLKIRRSLTPLLVKVAYQLSTASSLDPGSICATDPSEDPTFKREWLPLTTQLKCSTSPRYPLRTTPARACSLK
jgi:hypothetical protein